MRDCSVLCVPVVLPSADTVGVIEFTRDHLKPPFCEGDIQLIHAVVSWMAACIHENGLKRILDTYWRSPRTCSKRSPVLTEWPTLFSTSPKISCTPTVVRCTWLRRSSPSCTWPMRTRELWMRTGKTCMTRKGCTIYTLWILLHGKPSKTERWVFS